jgi:hypothetical protein
MKLIRCKNCNDVVRLIHTNWRKCGCGESGGQYNGITISATIGGNCEVFGIRNDWAEMSKEERMNSNGINGVIQGEYPGDVQIHRIQSSEGPSLSMIIEEINDIHKLTFTDDRKFTINLDGDKTPKFVEIPISPTGPSFKIN